MKILVRPIAIAQRSLGRYLYSSAAPIKGQSPTSLPTQWLPEVKKRLGKCIIFGLSAEQTKEYASISRELGNSWKAMLLASEGFLFGKGGAGLGIHCVVGDDMV